MSNSSGPYLDFPVFEWVGKKDKAAPGSEARNTGTEACHPRAATGVTPAPGLLLFSCLKRLFVHEDTLSALATGWEPPLASLA